MNSHHVIKTFVLAALMNMRTVVAQTNPPIPQLSTVGMAAQSEPYDPRMSTPIGHRQPRPKDVTVGEASKIDQIDAESAAVDRKLTICRGC
ncbi:hypothetical protein [Bradyrhizobium sp. STM 3557]|uniref:hypothetical protein n=1 Tax=Bradyrhizobium sp. STM 3557 TaxID=578920 RepID=UPI0038907B7E